MCSALQREHAAEAAHQEEKIAQLEHELEEATSNSMEMHKMLSEMLSAQKDTTTFQVWRSLINKHEFASEKCVLQKVNGLTLRCHMKFV